MPDNAQQPRKPRARTPNRSLFRGSDGWPLPSDQLVPLVRDHAGDTLLLSFSWKGELMIVRKGA